MKNKLSLNIYGMSCISCAKTIEFVLKKEKGIYDVIIDFTNSKASIIYDDDLIDPLFIIKKIKEIGYSASFYDESFNDSYIVYKKRLMVVIILAVLLFPFSMGGHIGLFKSEFFHKNSIYFQFLFTTLILIFGFDFFKNGIWYSLIKSKIPNMDTLIALGAGSGYISSIVGVFYDKKEIIYFESAGYIIAFVMIGKFLEFRFKRISQNNLKSLIFLKPKKAFIIEDEKEVEKDVNLIKKDELISVKSGQRIPVDGIVVSGFATVDESLVNGEIMVEKNVDDFVYAGSINIDGHIILKATKDGNNSFIDEVINLVENTVSQRPNIWKIADKISFYFVPSIILVSIISFLYWYIFSLNISFSLKVMISVMVISCPCAFGIAIPMVVSLAISKMTKDNILIKTPSFFEVLKDIHIVVFDKTGTLTEGKLKLTNYFCDIEEKEFLKIVSSLERNSTHPISKSILDEYKKYGNDFYDVSDFKVELGMGIVGKINGKRYIIGSERFINLNGINIDERYLKIKSNLKDKYKKIIWVCEEDRVIGVLLMSDKIREDALYVVRYLKDKGKKLILMSGDNYENTLSIKEELGFDEIYSDLLPSQKSEIINVLKKSSKILMVGDGVNDAIALKSADLSISFGNATEVAFENADIIILKNNLKDIIKLFEFSKYINRKINQNIFWAFFYNIISIPIAAGVFYNSYNLFLTPQIAALLMSLSSLSVVLNSLSIIKWKYLD